MSTELLRRICTTVRTKAGQSDFKPAPLCSAEMESYVQLLRDCWEQCRIGNNGSRSIGRLAKQRTTATFLL